MSDTGIRMRDTGARILGLPRVFMLHLAMLRQCLTSVPALGLMSRVIAGC
jgi:hypothetical protein